MAENKKLECLKKLQDILKERFELEQQAENLPAELRRREALLTASSTKLQQLKLKHENLLAELSDLTVKYEEASKQRTDYEKQIEFLNTQREYEAINKQIDEAKNQETSLLKLRKAKELENERVSEELENQIQTVNEQTAEVEEERGNISGQLEDIQNRIAEIDLRSEEIKGEDIPDELYAKFCNIIRKKDGLGVVPVHGQVCMGCNRVLPVQFVIDLRIKENAGDIEYCPYCSRIIWYEKLDAELEKNYIFEQYGFSKKKTETQHDKGGEVETESYDASLAEDDFDDFEDL